MGQFVDIYLPPSVPGYPCVSSPVFSTTITEASSGDEGRNQNWLHPKRTFKLPAGEARQWDVIQDLITHALVLGGPFNSFAFRDPLDFATVGLEVPNEADATVRRRLTAADQVIGTGDGFNREFQLVKSYTRGPASYVRDIGLPVLSSVLIADNGTPTTAFSLTRPGGLVTFDVAPVAGHVLTWGGLFDCPVRFEADDSLSALIQAFQAGGFADITLSETRLC